MESFKCVTPSWQEMVDCARKAADGVKNCVFRPDVVVALSRGGLVPARLLCDFLHVKECFSVKVDHWGVTATKDGLARLSQGLNVDLSGKRVLIVDDIIDTGESMRLVVEHVKEKNPVELKTVALINLKGSKFTPDFFGLERDWAWIIFPWNYMEDLVNLSKKLLESGYRGSLRDGLKENFGVELSEEYTEALHKQLEYVESRKV